MYTKIIIAFIFFGVFSVLAKAASFQCTMNNSEVENLICNNTNISLVDENLTAIYVEVRKNAIDNNQLKAQQFTWIKEKRNKCVDEECLMKVYQVRLEELTELINQFSNKENIQESSFINKEQANKVLLKKKNLIKLLKALNTMFARYSIII